MQAFFEKFQVLQKYFDIIQWYKEIKESPKFNFDKPLTAPDEMDEAFILDGGQLSNKELKELDAIMYEDVDEEADPLDILTSNQEEKEGL